MFYKEILLPINFWTSWRMVRVIHINSPLLLSTTLPETSKNKSDFSFPTLFSQLHFSSCGRKRCYGPEKGSLFSHFYLPSVTKNNILALKRAVFLLTVPIGVDQIPFPYPLPWPALHTETLKMEAACSCETSVSVYKTTACHNPEYHSLNCPVVLSRSWI
jgi:hypothetical protein